MKRRTQSRPQLSKAEARYRELVDELKMLTLAFPHFKDAYDKNDLPIPFLLKRGAARAKKRATAATTATANTKATKTTAKTKGAAPRRKAASKTR